MTHLKIHKQFKTVHIVNAVDKRPIHQWASITAVSEKGQADLSDNSFWDREGVILVEIMIDGRTVNSDLKTPTV